MSLAVFQADCQQAIESLKDFNNDQLNDVLSDDDSIEQLLVALDESYLKEIQEEKDAIQAANNSLVDLNLAREPELVERRNKVHRLGEEVNALTKCIAQKTKIMQDRGGDNSVEMALALLQTATAQAEADSEQFSRRFLDNEITFEAFIDEFLAKRKLAHLRTIKTEKLHAIATNQLPSPTNNYANMPPTVLNRGYFPGVVSPSPPSLPPALRPRGPPPYPLASTSPMPMPSMPTNYFQNHY